MIVIKRLNGFIEHLNNSTDIKIRFKNLVSLKYPIEYAKVAITFIANYDLKLMTKRIYNSQDFFSNSKVVTLIELDLRTEEKVYAKRLKIGENNYVDNKKHGVWNMIDLDKHICSKCWFYKDRCTYDKTSTIMISDDGYLTECDGFKDKEIAEKEWGDMLDLLHEVSLLIDTSNDKHLYEFERAEDKDCILKFRGEKYAVKVEKL